MNNIETRCPKGLFEEGKYGSRRLKGLNKPILYKFLRENVYHNIPKRDLETRYNRAYDFLKQIEKKENITEETLKELEERIALVLRVNEMKYCSFN